MKTIDTKRVLATFGLEPRRPVSRRALEDLTWLGIGVALGAGVVFASRSPTVRSYLSKARAALPMHDGEHKHKERAHTPVRTELTEPTSRPAHA